MNENRNQELIAKFNENIEKLVETYRQKDKNFFFTEKEMHAYLYHLCISDPIFLWKNRETERSLVHAEYPTPFKCQMGKQASDFSIVPDDKKEKMRSHIDMVLLNPNFVDWIDGANGLRFEPIRPIDYIKGLSNRMFQDYIPIMKRQYEQFSNERGEPILLFALEFKYIRGYEGSKQPLNQIRQDIKKLIEMEWLEVKGHKIRFTGEAKLLVFLHKGGACDEIERDKDLTRNSNYLQVRCTVPQG